MPNIKSAKKRVKINEKKNMENTMVRSQLKTIMKDVKKLAGDAKIAEAEEALNIAFSKIDKAQDKNIIHANKAARLKASLAKAVEDAKVNGPKVEIKKAAPKKAAAKAETTKAATKKTATKK